MKQSYYPVNPYIAAPTSVPAMMQDVLVSLVPALGMVVYLFGLQAVLLVLVSVVSCVGFELLFCCCMKKKQTLYDWSACVTGVLLAFCFPPEAPLWGVVVAAFLSMVVVKGLYGGLGRNFMNPALAGRMIIATVPMMMTVFTVPLPLQEAFIQDEISSATPMSYLGQGVLPPQSMSELFIGFHGGSLGEVSTMMLLLGLFYLIIRRVISPIIPLSFLGVVGVLSFFYTPSGIDPVQWTIAQLCSGGLVLGAGFMATDPTTSPITPRGQLIFGLGCGVLTLVLRYFGTYPEGVGFAILCMNCLVWLLDLVGAPRRFGTAHFERTKRFFVYVKKRLGRIYFVKPKMPKKPDFTVIKSYFSRPDGTVPGEKHLDQLEVGARNVSGFACVLVATGVCLTLVSNVTQFPLRTKIEQSNQKLLAQVMPLATTMSVLPYSTQQVSNLYAAYDQLDHVGFCAEVRTQGFNGEMSILVGMDLDSAVTGVTVLHHQETKYIGTLALEQSVLNRFAGRSGRLSLTGGNRIDGVSGATVTLSAVVDGVNSALSYIQELEREGAFSILSSEYF